jgi:Na+-driven multidrug efflux pump
MSTSTLKSKYIGDRTFYRRVLKVAVPIMIQSGITNFVSLLDNIMVGRVGTEQMSGVSIVNQLLFVFNLCLFGGMGGVGIFTAQYYGRQDREGIRNTFRFKMMLSLVLLLGGLGVFIFAGGDLVALFLHEGGETGDIALTQMYAGRYMRMMLWGLLPFALQQAYASTLRECGETLLPMKAGIAV